MIVIRKLGIPLVKIKIKEYKERKMHNLMKYREIDQFQLCRIIIEKEMTLEDYYENGIDGTYEEYLGILKSKLKI